MILWSLTQNGSRFLYRKSNTVLVIVQNTCKPISRLKMNGNRRDCYIKEVRHYIHMSETYVHSPKPYRNTLFSDCRPYVRHYFHDPMEFDRIGSLFEFWCAQSKFQSERSALRSGSPAIKKTNTDTHFSMEMNGGQASILYKKSLHSNDGHISQSPKFSRNTPCKHCRSYADHTFMILWSLKEWQQIPI